MANYESSVNQLIFVAYSNNTSTIKIAKIRHVCLRIIFGFNAGVIVTIGNSQNLELVRVIPVKESDRNTHCAFVVAWDRVGEGHLDGIVVVVLVVRRLALDLLMFAETQVVPHGHERQHLMAAAMVEVCEPTYIAKFDKSRALVINAFCKFPTAA